MSTLELPDALEVADCEMEHAGSVAAFLMCAPVDGPLGRSIVRLALDYADALQWEIARRKGDG